MSASEMRACMLVVMMVARCSGDCALEEEVDWGSYGYFQTCRAHHIKQALQENVMCQPSPTVVQLPLPNNTDVQQMTPTFVEILQCSGACHRGSQECVPTRTKEKKIPVMLARCGISTGMCEKECASVTVQEHVECGCDCGPLDPGTCPPETHTYNRDTCTCGCSDTAAKQRCLDSGRGWAEASCSCHCSAPQLACSVGLVWSNVTCTCLPEESVIHLEPEDTRAPRSGTALDSLLSWQMVTIIVLLVLIFALIVTIFALISKLQAAKRRIKTAKIQASARNQQNQGNGDNMYDMYDRPPAAKEVVVKAKGGKQPEKFYSEVYGESSSSGSGQAAPGTYCESPSSGFGSEASKYSTNDLHADTQGPAAAPSSSLSESIYHSAQTVRLNKKLQSTMAPTPPRTPQLHPHQPPPPPGPPQSYLQQQQQRLYPQHQPQYGQQQPLYAQQQPLYTQQHQEQHPLYAQHQPSPPPLQPPPGVYPQHHDVMASDPIDEAVRLLEHSAAMLH